MYNYNLLYNYININIYKLLVAVRYCVDLHTKGEARGM